MTTEMMELTPVVDDTRIDMARLLVKHLEEGNNVDAEYVLDTLKCQHEFSLFQEIGKITRQLHDALGTCQEDSRIADMTEREIPDARERLNFVIDKTEESAHRTLNAVDVAFPLSADLVASANEMNEEWMRFTRREMNADEFRALSKKIGEFLHAVDSSANTIHQSLSEVMMAQDFQDLTGQIIRQVIELVQELEDRLVKVIKCSTRRNIEPEKGSSDTSASGPQINKKDDPNVLSGQDEVDGLLSSLGF